MVALEFNASARQFTILLDGVDVGWIDELHSGGFVAHDGSCKKGPLTTSSMTAAIEYITGELD